MRTTISLSLLNVLILLTAGLGNPATVHAEQRDQAREAARSATHFLTNSVSTQGGYLWRYSADLSLREGEGVTRTQTVWVQPPGTPSVGEAFVRLYRATGERQFLDAALAAADALRQGQMRSGGWQASVEFEPKLRKKWAYRIDKRSAKAKDQSTLDDDKTQSAIRFLIQLDHALDFKNETIHEMTMRGLNALIEQGQFANGGFPQVWTNEKTPAMKSEAWRPRFPESWPREYPGHREYWHQYTLNDNLASDVMTTLFLAEDVYDLPVYRKAAIRLADSLLLTQMPMPQPAWAQQYNNDLEPIWARKFEPPAISGSESQTVIRTLLLVYRRIGGGKYLDSVERALDYLQRSELPDGRLARFYELQTNRPLFFTKQYELTYDDSDCPTHYSFHIENRLEKLRQQYETLRERPWKTNKPKDVFEFRQSVSNAKIDAVVSSLDERGAWVTDSGLRYHRYQGPVIEMAVTVENLNMLAAYLGQVK